MGDDLSCAGLGGGKPAMTGAGRTDTGPVRTANEDHWHIDAGRGLFIVADGMGGHQAGEVAAHLAVAEVVADLVASAGDGFAWPLGRDTAQSRAVNRIGHALRRANDAVAGGFPHLARGHIAGALIERPVEDRTLGLRTEMHGEGQWDAYVLHGARFPHATRWSRPNKPSRRPRPDICRPSARITPGRTRPVGASVFPTT